MKEERFIILKKTFSGKMADPHNSRSALSIFFLFLISVRGKCAVLGTKMVHPHISGSTLRIVFKFCTMKRAKRYLKIILMFFRKELCLGQMGHFG